MEILGLLDTLESTILDGFKVPMTKKTIINEEKVLQIIDKIRLVAQGGGGLARKGVDQRPLSPKQETIEFSEARGAVERLKDMTPHVTSGEEKATDIIENAYKIAKEVRMGADKYADEVLSGLEATSSRILRAVKAGRSRLVRTNTPENRIENE